MHAVNEFVGAWWPIILFMLTVVWASLALWVKSKIGETEEKVDERIGAARAALNAKIEENAGATSAKIDQVIGATDEKIADLAGKLTTMIAEKTAATNAAFTMLNERVAKSEARCETLTPSADFHKALLQIGEMGGDMKAIRAELAAVHGELKANQRSVERLYDFQLENSKS